MRKASEFFAHVVCRFVLRDVGVLLDKCESALTLSLLRGRIGADAPSPECRCQAWRGVALGRVKSLCSRASSMPGPSRGQVSRARASRCARPLSCASRLGAIYLAFSSTQSLSLVVRFSCLGFSLCASQRVCTLAAPPPHRAQHRGTFQTDAPIAASAHAPSRASSRRLLGLSRVIERCGMTGAETACKDSGDAARQGGGGAVEEAEGRGGASARCSLREQAVRCADSPHQELHDLCCKRRPRRDKGGGSPARRRLPVDLLSVDSVTGCVCPRTPPPHGRCSAPFSLVPAPLCRASHPLLL